jgi:hypothetical protein
VDPKILKGVAAKKVIYDQVAEMGEGWVEQEFVLLILTGLPKGTGLPNE